MAVSKPTETVPIPRVLLPNNAAQRSQLSTRVIQKRWLWRSPPPKWRQTKRSELRIAGSNRSGQSHSGPTAKHKKHKPAPPYSAGLFNQGCSQSLRCATALLHPLLLGIAVESEKCIRQNPVEKGTHAVNDDSSNPPMLLETDRCEVNGGCGKNREE